MKRSIFLLLPVLAGCVPLSPVIQPPAVVKPVVTNTVPAVKPLPFPGLQKLTARATPAFMLPPPPAPPTGVGPEAPPPPDSAVPLAVISKPVAGPYMLVQWLARPVNYSLDVSTDLTAWRSLGSIVDTNFVTAPGQALISTNFFPSGQAVVFTNGDPVVIFLDYAIDAPMKFYRIREVRP